MEKVEGSKAKTEKKIMKTKKAPKKATKKAPSKVLVKAGSKAMVVKKKDDKEAKEARLALAKLGYIQSVRVKIPDEKLNDNEKKLWGVLKKRHGKPMSLEDLSKEAFAGTKPPKTQGEDLPGGYRRALNSLRRLVASGRVKRAGRGEYASA
jgi:hypothetical protein